MARLSVADCPIEALTMERVFLNALSGRMRSRRLI
jgi:hypothetical protein